MLLIGQDIDGQRQTAPRQHGDQTLVAECTDETIDGHWRDMRDAGAEVQTEATMGRQQGIAGHCGPYMARAENEVGEDREHGFAPRTLEAPDGEPAQPDAHIMRVTCQTPTPTTGGFVFQLKAEGQHERHHQFDKRLPIVQQTNVGGFIVEIKGDGPVFTGLARGVSHGSCSGQMVAAVDDPRWR